MALEFTAKTSPCCIWLRRYPGDESPQAQIYRAALRGHHGSCPPRISMSHLSHDGRKYDTVKKKDEADKAFAKSFNQRGRNSRDS